MKKKIKDLTLEEVRKICEDKFCSYCPLQNACCIYGDKFEYISNEEFEKEIEVEEDEE